MARRDLHLLIRSTLLAATAASLGGCITDTGCGDLEPTLTPFDVADFAFTAAEYDQAVSTSEFTEFPLWADLDDASRCEAACALASDNIDLDSSYEALAVDSCSFTPAADVMIGGGTI
ncbi:MAG: hypothetical protein KC457_14910, partial [Myxococcales bacterium]|nr:hypothetical protein [Myxococcales bacterium]